MSFILNENFVFIGEGDTLKKEGDFFLDESHTKALLLDIADTNDLIVNTRANKLALFTEIANYFATNGVSKMTEEKNKGQELEDAAKAIIADGIDAGKSDDDIMVELVGLEGIGFKQAGTIFKKITEKEGMRLSAKDRKEAGFEILESMEFLPETTAAVDAACAQIESEVADTTPGQAMGVIRAYAKEHELELPKKAKGGGTRGSSKVMQAIKWHKENPEATKEEFMANVATLVESEKQVSKYGMFYDIGKVFLAN